MFVCGKESFVCVSELNNAYCCLIVLNNLSLNSMFLLDCSGSSFPQIVENSDIMLPPAVPSTGPTSVVTYRCDGSSEVPSPVTTNTCSLDAEGWETTNAPTCEAGQFVRCE